MKTQLMQDVDTNYKIRYRDNGSIVIVSPTDRESSPVGYQGIAKLDGYMATSDYYKGVLPTLFKVVAIID